MSLVKIRLIKNGKLTKKVIRMDEMEAANLVELGEAVYVGRVETTTAFPSENAMRDKPRKRVRG